MLFDGASLVSYQGKITSILEYLSPHDLDIQLVDIDLSKLNAKDPKAAKPVFVFDRISLDMTFSKPKSALPSQTPSLLQVSERVNEYLNQWLGKAPSEVQKGNRIMIESNRFIRYVARPNPNWAGFINSINEDRHLFKAVGLYILEYLFKTRAGGYFVALSGGSDSTLSTLFIYFACHSLAYYAYQEFNFEIIDKISYVIGQPVSLVKKSLSPEERDSMLFVSGEQIRSSPNAFALANDIGEVAESDSLQYCLEDGTVISGASLCKRILNVAYLPMSFSGITKPFVQKLIEQLKCNYVEFAIQSPYDSFKKEMESILVK